MTLAAPKGDTLLAQRKEQAKALEEEAEKLRLSVAQQLKKDKLAAEKKVRATEQST